MKTQQILEFVKACEKLKTEKRHSWTSDSTRQESVAEHSWLMSLIAIILFEELETEVDRLKTLKMIIIHDLVEVFAGDVPVWAKTERAEFYSQKESQALDDLLKLLPTGHPLAREFRQLWEEFEEKKTPEAKLAKAIDKSEVLIQHNISDINTWNDGDYNFSFREGFYDFDPVIRDWKDAIDAETMAKIQAAGTTNLLIPEDLRRQRQSKKGPRISAIAALSKNRVIGKAGRLPWDLPSDLKRMRRITLGHPIIMGRKTHESIGRALPNRTNIIVTRQPDYKPKGSCLVLKSLEEAIEKAKEIDPEEIFIFGGGDIYTQALPVTERLYLTVIDEQIDGDTFFPDYSEFDRILFESVGKENGYCFRFLNLERSQ